MKCFEKQWAVRDKIYGVNRNSIKSVYEIVEVALHDLRVLWSARRARKSSREQQMRDKTFDCSAILQLSSFQRPSYDSFDDKAFENQIFTK